LRQIRAENEGLTLQAFKQTLREQYFYLQLDREKALAAIPKMLSANDAERTHVLEALHETAEATGEVTGERKSRLAQVEQLLSGDQSTASPRKTGLKATPKAA